MPAPVIDARELERVGELDADLDARGIPRRPVMIVRGGAGTPNIRPGRAPILVLVREDDRPVADALRRVVDVMIAAPGIDPAAVETPDPLDSALSLAEAVERSPVTALSLATLLRCRAYEDVARGLVAESATYSALLASAEFNRWLAAHPDRRCEPEDDGHRVRVARDGNVLRVTLDRPRRHNAVDGPLRDALLDALAVARWDRSLTVILDGAGQTFSSGGDLAEFGTAPDPAAAHLVRLDAAVGAALHDLRDRVRVHVHGQCFGAGVELPAFAAHVVAHPDASFTLPELAMGLIPGAGGTVSLPRRIGPQRTLWLAASGAAIDARTALAWGLVDELAAA